MYCNGYHYTAVKILIHIFCCSKPLKYDMFAHCCDAFVGSLFMTFFSVRLQTLGGCVESLEDHGYLLDIGISGTKAFLPKEISKETKSPKNGKNIICVAQEGKWVRLSWIG